MTYIFLHLSLELFALYIVPKYTLTQVLSWQKWMPFHHWKSRDCKVKHFWENKILFSRSLNTFVCRCTHLSCSKLAGCTVLASMDPLEYSLPYKFVGLLLCVYRWKQVQISRPIQKFLTAVEINISLCDKVYKVILESWNYHRCQWIL